MSALDPHLSRRTHQPPPALVLWDEVRLPLARVHEVCGAARRTLALRIASEAGGAVFWIAPAHGSDPLNPDGARRYLNPGDITFVTPRQAGDLLWCMEECLRSGAVPVVVAELPDPPAMTPVRRLHLAAEAGAGQGRCRPLGLILSVGQGGAAGIETRWRMEPAHAPDKEAWHLTRLRARMAPPKDWRLAGECLHAMSGQGARQMADNPGP